jgi:hypothetical protein
MHFSYIYYIFQYSYMFRSVRAILRELHSKMINCSNRDRIDSEQAGSRHNNQRAKRLTITAFYNI